MPAFRIFCALSHFLAFLPQFNDLNIKCMNGAGVQGTEIATPSSQ